MIPLSVPNLKGNELTYVTHAVETEWVSTAGPYVEQFEEKTAEYCGAAGAVSCQNGTSGLHISLLLCGVKPGEEVIVPTLTFIAAVNPVKYVGAEPVFMDCDDGLCMDPDKLEEFCQTECELRDGVLTDCSNGKAIRALVVVHVFGNMAKMPRILEIANRFHLKVIEDATEALGTYYTSGPLCGKYAGTMGDIGVYSFNGNKIITTGGGGMIVSMDRELLQRAKHLTTQAKADQLNFIHDEIGYNYRMTNLQAALGLAQLEQLEGFIRTKEENYLLYQEKIAEIPGLSFLPFDQGIRSNHWFYSVLCQDDFPMKRSDLIAQLSQNGIQTRPIWGLIHQQKPYLNSKAYHIERAIYYWEKVVNVPCSTNLTADQVEQVVSQLKKLAGL